jgi:acetyl esterase/lipase
LPLDSRVKRFLDVLAAGEAANRTRATLAQRRASLVELMKLSGPEAPVAHMQDVTLGASGRIAARIYTPPVPLDAPLPGLLYFHGGGWVAGSIATHEPIARALAHSGRCRVISVEYRLAPEHPFPAGLEDALEAAEYVLEHAVALGLDPKRLGICGDSAGGTLAAATCQSLRRNAGRPPLALQVLICPILDVGGSSESRRDFRSGYLIEESVVDEDLAHYVPAGTDRADPRLSPLRAADLSGMPRTIVHTAEFDPFRDEGRDYFSRLTPTSSGLSYTCHGGMIHLFYGLGAVIPHAQRALEQIGQEIHGAFG